MLTPVTPEFIERLEANLPPQALRPNAPHYAEDPRGRVTGQVGAVVAPSTTEDVAKIIKLAGEARVGIVPFGGGTGLVRGQVQPDGPTPLILSMERMTAIRGVYPEESVLVAEGGAVLAQIQSAAEEAGLLFPLSYGSEGTARIGGALSVNSGGLNVLRYGTARELCLGLEAVLPDGSIWYGLKRLRKDNTGYDLRHLLMGAEGTLGVITAAALRLFPRPARTATAMIAVTSPEAALTLYARLSEMSGGSVSAFELLSGTGLAFLEEEGFAPRAPFEGVPDWSILVELGTPEAIDPDAVLMAFFEGALESGLAQDCVIAQSGAQRDALWRIREEIPLANKSVGAVASHDISLPLSEVAAFMAETDRKLAEVAPLRINAFGHLGDGNLHYNIFPPKGDPAPDGRHLEAQVTQIVYDGVAERGGSFSAEHGVGRLKVGALETYGDPAKLAALRANKSALDPVGIKNPGAVLRAG